MSENMQSNVQLENGNGSITFAADVVATIAGLAATEVEGVASMSGGTTGLADILSRRMQPARALTKGVRVELNETSVSVHVTIIVEYGSPVPEVAANIQENIKKAIETMSGLAVTSVDVHVQGVSFERENRTAVELEMKQRLMLQKKQDEDRARAGEADEVRPDAPQPDDIGGMADEAAGDEPGDDFDIDLPDEGAADEDRKFDDQPDEAQESGDRPDDQP